MFSDEECRRILALRGEARDARIVDDPQGMGTGQTYRKGQVGWIRPTAETEWIFTRTFGVVRQVNDRCFRMELAGFTEPLQVAEYGQESYYDWHLDIDRGPHSIRKLSFIVQLSDPAEYEGGEVELSCGRESASVPREQGGMTVFPSYLLHRVKAVTCGVRCSLVGWIGGPPYR